MPLALESARPGTADESAPGVGLEPTTFGLTARRSAELSYPGKESPADLTSIKSADAIVDGVTARKARFVPGWGLSENNRDVSPRGRITSVGR